MVNKKKNIFISYRVRDTQAATGRLVDALKQHFDSDQIFMDIDKIEPGLDFTEVISKSLDNCDVMLAMIGPDWMAFEPEKKTYRINNDNDWVRLEIATALRRNIRVVPVLLEGASLPDEADLPEDLKPLLRRQSYEITNKRWQYDSGELIDFLHKLFGGIPKPEPPPPPPPNPAPTPPKKSYKKYWLISVVGFLLLLLIGVCNQEVGVNPDPQPVLPETNIVAPVIKNIAGTWYDPVGQARFVIVQDMARFSIMIYAVTNENTGSGSGVVMGDNVTMNVEFYLQGNTIPAQMNLVLSADEKSLVGNILIENSGASYSEKASLVRQ